MYDGGKIIAGLIVFVVLITIPLWYNPLFGQTGPAPKPEKPKEGKCVVPGERMKEEHMQILNDWRDRVIRDGVRYYDHHGQWRERSLTLTCLGCHANKKNFCGACHDYAGVKPYCWDCHIIPEEK